MDFADGFTSYIEDKNRCEGTDLLGCHFRLNQSGLKWTFAAIVFSRYSRFFFFERQCDKNWPLRVPAFVCTFGKRYLCCRLFRALMPTVTSVDCDERYWSK